MRVLLAELRAEYDFVVVDTAPLLPVADAAILSRAVDGMLVLANVTRVRRSQLAESLQTLEQVKGRVLGLVLNQVSRPEDVYAYRQTGEEPSSGPAPEAVPLLVRPAVRSLKPVKAVGRGGL